MIPQLISDNISCLAESYISQKTNLLLPNDATLILLEHPILLQSQNPKYNFMFNFRKLFFILLFSTIFSGFVTAQPPPSAPKGNVVKAYQEPSLADLSASEKFSSTDGRFTIALPNNISGFSAITPKTAGTNRSGSQYQWRVKEGLILISYADILDESFNVKTEQDRINYLAGYIDGVIKSLKAELISSSQVKLENFDGVKANFRLQNGLNGIQRTYLVNKRQYSLTAAFAQDVPNAEKLINLAFDSLSLVSQSAVDEELRRKIEQSTPSLLPQEPIARKEKSDTEDDNLKGRVKTVTQESEDLSGTWSIQGRHLDSIEDFNTDGYSVKQLLYDSKAKPFQITVFGYIDGARVRNSEIINYDSDPPIMALSGTFNKKENNKPDLRYDFKHEYKYVNGKLAEEVWIRNNGSLWLRYVYNYKNNQLEKLVYSEDGKLNQKYLVILDDKGNEIERTNFNILGIQKGGDTKYLIKYDSFDEKGNWTKKTTSKLEMENGKQVSKPSSITYRTITYFQ